jgi:molybdopterin-guanine dinucleotide biosynthesis protein B
MEHRKATVRPTLPPIVSIVGRAKIGKTTFLVKLISELTRRNIRVAVIKHTVHTFDFAQEGKDTWKHAAAGAQIVALSSPNEVVITRPLDQEMAIDEIAALLGDVDLILTEGYKRAHKPKIEISRRERGTEPVSRRQDIVAIVSDHPITLDVPRFDLDDAAGVADLIQARYLEQGPDGEANCLEQ